MEALCAVDPQPDAAHMPCVQTSKPPVESSKTRAVPSHLHGTWNGYAAYKCRCVECAEAGRQYGIARRAGKATPPELLTPKREASHGTAARYRAGCDCEPCVQAGAKRRVPLGVPSTFRRYRYRIEPSPSAESALNRLLGAVRWVHIEYIARARAAYTAGEGHLSGYTGQKLVVTDGRANPDTAWLLEFPSSVLRASLSNAANAYQSFFDSISGRRKGPRIGRPQLKKKTARGSAEFPRAAFSIRGGWENTRAHGGGQLKLSKIGLVAVNWHRPLPSVPSTVTITRESDGTWWATFVVEVPKRVTTPVKNRIAAIDLGLESFTAIVYSDGTREKIANPRFLRESERKLARAQKNLSRKAKGSNNREKARVKVARTYADVRNQRLNHARQLAARLIRENQTIVVESLSIAGMAKSRLGKSINDAGWALFLQALTSGAEHKGREIIAAPPGFPSSRTCALCGVNSGAKALSFREWTCECGARLDRDWNAATNLLMLAARSAESQNACGRDVRRQLASASGAVAEEAGTRRSGSAA